MSPRDEKEDVGDSSPRDPDGDDAERVVGPEGSTPESSEKSSEGPTVGSPDETGSVGGDSRNPTASTRSEWREAETDDSPPPRRETETTSGWRLFAYDVVSSVVAVGMVGVYLFAISGVWPPLVAVESGSMTPNMQINDLVFVAEADRFPGEGAHAETGVVTTQRGRDVDYRKFGGYGDVIVYERNGDAGRTPIIHRARLWVEKGENWYDRADPDHIGSATACEIDDDPDTDTGLRNCPAPHAGFITKGDDVEEYDQVNGLSGPVKPEWVVGTAELRVPGLGWVRLQS